MLQASHVSRLSRGKAGGLFQACGQRTQSKAFAARPHSRRSVVVRANWGAPVDFSSAKVVSNKQVFPGMHQIMVDVGSAVASSYTKPGQYLQAKVAADAKPGFFAIASAPAADLPGTVELLIKSQPGSSSEDIASLDAGGALMVSPAQGKGFPLDKIADVDVVLMFATGSGVSPLKAVVESGVLQAGSPKQVHLFYGTKSKDATAYSDLFHKWSEAGVKVTQVFSGSDKQYVQSVLEGQLNAGLLPAGSEARVGVLLCGHKDMCNAVTTLLVERGVSKDLILMNF